VVIFGRTRKQLNNGCRAVENLSAAIEGEVVVGGNKGERDAKGGTETMCKKHRVLEPLQTPLDLRGTICDTL
jgi:hypothetical protein